MNFFCLSPFNPFPPPLSRPGPVCVRLQTSQHGDGWGSPKLPVGANGPTSPLSFPFFSPLVSVTPCAPVCFNGTRNFGDANSIAESRLRWSLFFCEKFLPPTLFFRLGPSPQFEQRLSRGTSNEFREIPVVRQVLIVPPSLPPTVAERLSQCSVVDRSDA